jgi:hypothetical protein
MNTTQSNLGGQSAFPTATTGKWAGSGGNQVFAPDMTDGMTVRQWYKSQVVNGVLADKRYAEAGNETACVYEVARYAGLLADALIAEDEQFAVLKSLEDASK